MTTVIKEPSKISNPFSPSKNRKAQAVNLLLSTDHTRSTEVTYGITMSIWIEIVGA